MSIVGIKLGWGAKHPQHKPIGINPIQTHTHTHIQKVHARLLMEKYPFHTHGNVN
jgi:hypothetical protein